MVDREREPALGLALFVDAVQVHVEARFVLDDRREADPMPLATGIGDVRLLEDGITFKTYQGVLDQTGGMRTGLPAGDERSRVPHAGTNILPGLSTRSGTLCARWPCHSAAARKDSPCVSPWPWLRRKSPSAKTSCRGSFRRVPSVLARHDWLLCGAGWSLLNVPSRVPGFPQSRLLRVRHIHRAYYLVPASRVGVALRPHCCSRASNGCKLCPTQKRDLTSEGACILGTAA